MQLSKTFAWLLLGITLSSASVSLADSKQVDYAAKVNGSVIPLIEFSQGIGNTIKGANTPDISKQIIAAMINQVIDQELIIQNANNSGLSQREDVKARVALAKRAAESDIYLNSKKFNNISISKDDVEEFASDHPEYLAGRKNYQYIDISIDNDTTLNTKNIIFKAFESDGITGVLEKIKKQNLKYTMFNGWQATEQIPSNQIRDRLLKLKDNESAIYMSDDSRKITILRLLQQQPAPVSFDQVKDSIAKTLIMKNLQDAQQKYINQLRSEATIEINPELNAEQPPATSQLGNKHLSNTAAISFYATMLILAITTIVGILSRYETYISPYKDHIKKLLLLILTTGTVPFFSEPIFSIYLNDKLGVSLKSLAQGFLTGALVSLVIYLIYTRLEPRFKILRNSWLIIVMLIFARLFADSWIR